MYGTRLAECPSVGAGTTHSGGVRSIVVLTAAVLVLAAQTAGISVTGVVRSESDHAPLDRVEVVLVEAGTRVLTEPDGSYRLVDVAPGWHTLRFARLGYRGREIRTRVSGPRGPGLDVSLVVEPVELEPLEVVAGRSTGTEVDPSLRGVPGIVTIGPDDLRDSPRLASSDALEAISGTPAVRMDPGSIGAYHVRGGPADGNLVVFDGAPLLNPYHQLGLSSVLNPDVVGGLVFHTASPSAKYGGRLSSVLEVSSRASDPERMRVSGGLENYAARVALEGPFRPGSGTLLLAARHSYEGPFVAPSQESIRVSDFRDVVARMELPLLGGVLSVTWLSAEDRLDYDAHTPVDGTEAAAAEAAAIASEATSGSADLPRNRLSWSTGLRSLRWRVGADPGVDVAIYSSDAAAHAFWDPVATELAMDNEAEVTGARLAVTGTIGASAWLWGVDAERQEILYRLSGREVQPVDASETSDRWATFGQVALPLGSSGGITPGLRLSGGGGTDPTIEPRVSWRLEATPAVSVGVAYARLTQALQSVRNEESLLGLAAGIDLLGATPAVSGRPAVSDQLVGVVSMRWGDHLEAAFDGYVRWLDHLVLVAPTTAEPFSVGELPAGNGRAAGLGLTLTGGWDRVRAEASGYVGRTRRSVDESRYVPGFHRSHWLRAAAAVDLTRGLTLRTALEGGAGTATSAQVGGLDFEPLDPFFSEGELSGTPRRVGGDLNPLRAPSYVRVDIGARYRVEGAGRDGRRFSIFGTLTNVSNHVNVRTWLVGPDGVLDPVPFGPIGLRAGIEWRF